MAQLTDEHRTFIVQRLACFDTHTVVAAAVKETFDVEVTRQQVYHYDPKRTGYTGDPCWSEIFDATRKAFLEDVADIGIAHRSVRLRRLDEMCRNALASKNYALAASLMEQAAKESGNAFTNKRELSGPGGAPLPVSPSVTIFSLPDNGRA